MKKQFTPRDMGAFRYLSDPVLSPDGRFAAYVCACAEEEGGTFPTAIHLYEVQSGTDRVLTPEGHREKQPAFLPDGRLAFLSDESGVFQLCVREVTGESRQITTLRHGVVRYALAADGSKAAFEATLWPEDVDKGQHFTTMTAQERKAWEEELDWRPYHITDLTYKLDEWFGMRKGEFSHIGVVSLDGGAPALLGTGGMEAIYPVLNHDGSKVAFYGYPYDGPRGFDTEVFVMNADGSDMEQLTSGVSVSADTHSLFTKDDRAVIFAAYADLPDHGISLLPYRVELADKRLAALMDPEDEAVCHGVNPMVASRTVMGENRSYLHLSEGGEWLYFLTALKAQTRICRVSIDGQGKAELVLDGASDISAFSLGVGDAPVCIMGDEKAPGELWLAGERVTDSNPWLREFAMGRLESRWITSRDGVTPLQYFLLYPADYEQGKTYPAVLDIKGGPTTMYGRSYWHEFHALSAAGFAVIYGNPRGSVGFGHGFCANGDCWKPSAMEDLLDMLEDAIALGFIDRTRVGVTGGSYGGYMTNKLIGRTEYFAAAVTQRCLINPAVSYGTGDMGFVNYGEVSEDFTMLGYLVDRARGNPITYIDNINIPVLILHGFKDYRCGFEQAEQAFIALKDRHPDLPVRLVMFPEENHAVTRTGKLHSQIRHLSELVDWFCKYLKKGEAQHG